jgi:hypothetical protein
MKHRVAIAVAAISTIAFSAAAQQSSDQRSNKWRSLRLAQNKCSAIIVSIPSHKISRDELDNKLSKNFKWNKDCVARLVGIYNNDLDEIQAQLHSPKCDPTLTQRYVEHKIKEAKDLYDSAVNEACRHPLKP